MGISLAEIIQATIAGFVSFISPCVLPLIPAYISYITGETLSELKSGETSTKKLLINSVAFVLGFSVVFILLGATATFVGKFLSRNKKLFEFIAGIIVIIFGLHTAQIVRFNFLGYEKKMNVRTSTPSLLKAFLMGFAFSFGWTPCVGPILGTILIMAGTHSQVLQGIILLTFYSLGLGIPFVITALAINKFFDAFKAIKRYFGQVEMFAGLLIIGIGLALVFGLGLHSDYIVATIIVSIGFAILSISKVSLRDAIGILTILGATYLALQVKFIDTGKINLNLVPFVLLLFAGIISMYKVGRQNE
ncbi:cytochrome c biogenesis CcdA family protein [Caldisericum exile]|uniref:Cytochrome c-type biogenesis protein CcdA n=1 Tax=Caldisericum exile (strain DSM 21853 / NBRC 104410 / AZM16c01) TaxID=511051 RepID=A0A7U6GF18_CALEA|nr:cytochrome c biogenesis protein CcdA [Caldisericum exile]BAL81193.1 putative cytochrome c-type biogenesis protein CcdA [Caldisericum exile AZM16c01]